MTVSIGISFHPDNAGDAEVLLRAADYAMYLAKGEGKNSWQVCPKACPVSGEASRPSSGFPLRASGAQLPNVRYVLVDGSDPLFEPEALTMAQPEAKRLNPFLRDAAISFVPQLTDDQLDRITRAITALNPGTLVSRMTDFTAMIQGFPVVAETAQEANRITWATISREVRDVRRRPPTQAPSSRRSMSGSRKRACST